MAADEPSPRPSRRPLLLRDDGAQPLSRVGIIAFIGFALGIAWPRLAGVSLVPEAPVEEGRARSDAEEEPVAPALMQESETREIKPTDQISIGKAQVTSCRNSEGKPQGSCDAIDSDRLLHPVLQSLPSCPAAKGAFGTLSLGLELDFADKKVKAVQSGRSTDLPAAVAKEVLRCAEEGLASVSVEGVPAEHSSYTVFYSLEFKTPEQVIEAEGEVTPAAGKATVRWRTALIREEADREGKVLERLLSGAQVVVTGRKGEWYRVKFDARGREGWVHGAAIGMKD